MYNFLIDHLSFLTNQPYRLEKLAWEKFWSTFKGERGTFFVLKRLKGYKGSWFQNLRSLHASIFCFSTPLKILSMSSYQIPAARVRQLSPYHFLFFCLFIYFSSFFFFYKIRRSSVFREILSSEMPGQRKLRITVNETIQGLRPERTASLCPNPEKLILLLVPSASPRLSCSRHRLVCNKIPCEPSDGLYCPSRSPPTIPHRNIWIPSRTGRTLLSRVKLEGPSKYTDIELWRQSIANYTG